MDLVIKLVMLIVFFGVMIGIGLYCRKHATDVNGFVLGGRSVGPWLTAFAYGTSYFSAVVFVGYAGQFGWKYGIAATWAGLGNAFLGSLLAWAVLGRRTRIMTQHLDSATMPQFFGERFESKPLKLAASAIIFIFLIPYTASLYNGLSRLFGMAFDIDYSVCVIVMAVLTGIYVIAGGYMATAINDFIQGIIMIFGIVAVVAAVLNGQGGFLAALDALLYFYGGRRLLWELKWYWGACGALLAALFLVGRLILFAVLVYGITPFPQMLLASYLLVEKGLGLPGKAADTTALVLTVALIAGHFLWLRRLEQRAQGEAERPSASALGDEEKARK